jgi:hypothetical protein
MKFVLVNDRTPYLQSFRALCCEPIAGTDLREIATRLPYCDHRCYFGYRKLEGWKRSKSSKAVVLTSSIATPLCL